MKDKLAVIFLIFIGILFYSLTIKGVLGNPRPEDFKNKLDQKSQALELSPERGRFANTLALAEFHTYDLGQVLADAVYPDVGVYNGKFFSFFAPGVSYLALPFYLLGRKFNMSLTGAFSLVPLLAIFNMLLIFFISRKIFKLPSWAAAFASLVFGFGSTAWSYAITLYQHQFTVFFMLSSFLAAYQYKNSGRSGFLWGLWVFLAYGLAITVDYPNAVLLLPVVVYFLAVSVRFVKDKLDLKILIRPAMFISVISLFAVGAWNAYHNQVNFGSWKKLSGELVDYSTIKELDLAGRPDSNAALTQLSEQKGLQSFFREVNVPFSFYTLTVSPDRGLFVFAPIFLLALFGIRRGKSYGLEQGILLSLAAVNLFLYSSWGDPWGGWAYGPRYLIPSMAVLSIFVAVFASQNSKVWRKVIVFALVAYSSLIAVIGALTTNAIPPKIEAVSLPDKRYNFLFNWALVKKGESSSLLYNTYFKYHLSLMEYMLVIYGALVLIMVVILFLMPRLEKK